MSKYIDAEFEIDHYTSMTTHPTPDVSEKDKRDSLIILEALRRAKYIDIVRCQDCKHATIEDGKKKPWEGNITCELDGIERQWFKQDFCSYGERKDDE